MVRGIRVFYVLPSPLGCGEGGGTECFFCFHAIYAVFAVDAAGEFPDFFVEVWYTQFERFNVACPRVTLEQALTQLKDALDKHLAAK